VVLEAFRPSVADRLGIGPEALPDSVVYCSITGFGPEDRRAGHDLNYMGWAGALAPTAPAMPPLPVADLAAGALTAVSRVHAELEQLFETRQLAEWLDLFDGEDVAVGPVATWDEAKLMSVHTAITPATPPSLGEHTVTWRTELGLESPD